MAVTSLYCGPVRQGTGSLFYLKTIFCHFLSACLSCINAGHPANRPPIHIHTHTPHIHHTHHTRTHTTPHTHTHTHIHTPHTHTPHTHTPHHTHLTTVNLSNQSKEFNIFHTMLYFHYVLLYFIYHSLQNYTYSHIYQD